MESLAEIDSRLAPDAAKQSRARDRFSEIAPQADDIEIKICDTVQFFDAGVERQFEAMPLAICGRAPREFKGRSVAPSSREFSPSTSASKGFLTALMGVAASRSGSTSAARKSAASAELTLLLLPQRRAPSAAWA